jgi:NDP-sugar pyrophosphorylase family protein
MVKKAIILAAGKGTRMKDLTAELPKPMLPVAGKPVLEHIVRNLAAAGVNDILIITGYKAETVENHFKDGKAWNCSIRYVRQQTQDGTGRVVALGREFAGADPFFLVYGDILVEPGTYRDLIAFFEAKSKPSGVITVKLGEDVSKGGLLVFDNEFRLTDLVEKPTEGELERFRKHPRFRPWYNAGLYIFGPSLFPHIDGLRKSARGEYELTDAIRSLAQSTGNTYGFEIQGYWIDVRDPELLARAQTIVRA